MSEPVKKVAVILNGDREQRHLGNVERALKNVLIPEGYETWVVSPNLPGALADHYFEGTRGGVQTLLKQLKGRVGPDTEVVLYITGHGEKSGFCLESDCQTETFLEELDGLSKGSTRRVVMDQNYGGRFITLFMDDPKTLFISAGSRGETDICQEIAPSLWASKGKVPDQNGDGVNNWEGRFDYAVAGRTFSSPPQFSVSEGYPLEGRAPFPAAVTEIADEKELDEFLQRLRPGQYAVINFSAVWCEPCKPYKSDFARFARVGGGRHLFLMTENTDLAQKWGISGFPGVVIVNWRAERVLVEQRNKVVQEVAQFELPLEERLMARSVEAEKIKDNPSRAFALQGIVSSLTVAGLKERGMAVFEKLIATAEKMEEYWYQAFVLQEIAYSLSAAGLKEKAAVVFEKSIAAAEKIEKKKVRAAALQGIASSLSEAGLAGRVRIPAE